MGDGTVTFAHWANLKNLDSEKKGMARKGWKTINIREETYNYLQSMIAKYPSLGYATVVDLVRDALRDKVIQIQDRLGIDPKESVGP